MMKKLFFLFFLMRSLPLLALTTPGTLMLWNDSHYILTASVYTQYGEFLGQITLQPGQQSSFTTSLYSTPINRPGAPNYAITPYRTIWQCAGGSIYSMCTDGSTGSLIRASLCQGSLMCTSKKEPEKEKEPETPPKNQK